MKLNWMLRKFDFDVCCRSDEADAEKVNVFVAFEYIYLFCASSQVQSTDEACLVSGCCKTRAAEWPSLSTAIFLSLKFQPQMQLIAVLCAFAAVTTPLLPSFARCDSTVDGLTQFFEAAHWGGLVGTLGLFRQSNLHKICAAATQLRLQDKLSSTPAAIPNIRIHFPRKRFWSHPYLFVLL